MRSKYSIAVLPFLNMSPEKENEYFSDGISEEILNALSKIEGLHVTARTSSFAFKNKNVDVREIGKKLNVSLILEGSTRKSNDIARITAQLINVEDGFHIWSETWDRDLKDIFIVQAEIAAIIAEKINKDIEPGKLLREQKVENTEAFDLYLKGKYLQNQWSMAERDKIIKHYEDAIKLDPKLVNAYIGLCDMYTWMSSTGFIDAKEAFQKTGYYIQKVLEIDKNSPDIHRIIAGKNFWIEWNLPLALENINIALKGKPSFPDALVQKGLILAAMARVEEAFDCFFQAERLNPFADTVNYTIGFVYHSIGEYSKALEFMEKNIKLNPNWDAQYFTKVEALCSLGRYEEAWQAIERFSEMSHIDLAAEELKAYYYASKGEREKALEIVAKMESYIHNKKTANTPDPAFLSNLHLLLGNEEKALDYLQFGVEHRASPLLFTRINHLWSNLEERPKFKKSMEGFYAQEVDINKRTPTKKYKKSNISKQEAKRIATELEKAIHTEKAFLNPALTLYDLAELVNISTNQLSQVLNEFIGKNFYDYINGFRLEHFLALKNKEKFKHFTLLALAYECGFNSKTTFNAFFKKQLGKTPSGYFRK